MDESKWPALAIEGLLLAAVIAFVAAGRTNLWMIISLAILLFVLTVQGTSQNVRFLYLYPIMVPSGVPSPGWDTWLLRLSIVFAVFFLFWGAMGSWKGASLIVLLALGTSIIWDQFLNDRHQKWIDDRIEKRKSDESSG